MQKVIVMISLSISLQDALSVKVGGEIQMTMVNRIWWDHLVPKEIASRRGELQELLKSFKRSEYGSHWMRAALTHGGLMRIKPGQKIPVCHAIFLKGRKPFIAPQKKLEREHRSVGRELKFHSGRTLAKEEVALYPELMIEVMDDPAMLTASANGITDIDEAKVTRPALIFSCPAAMLLRPEGFPKKSYVLYQHIFGHGGSYPDQGFFYVGVTTRSWQKRWSEHRRNIDKGSLLRFHAKFREERDAGRLTYVHHKVMGATTDIEQLYEAEEFMVEGHWNDERRLNMVPGGKSGLLYMRRHGMLDKSVVPMPDDRDRTLVQWLNEHPRKGLPAPWMADKWRDDDWAVAQICSREGRLSVRQVRAIRSLAQLHEPAEIAEKIGALDVEQVKRVLDGKTYTRVN